MYKLLLIGYDINMILRLVYIIFLGLLLATFIGVGIAAFYPSPVVPEPDLSYSKIAPREGTTEAAQLQEQEIRNQKVWQEHNKKTQLYSRNVSAIALGFAIILLIVSLTLFNKILIISDGILLGSVFTLIYSIIRGFESQDEKFRFIVVTIGLIIALFLGYIKFVKTIKKS